jgi:hypothetical protein
LAVLSSVKEFGRAIVGPLGAPSGTVETFIEVPFKLGERTVRPDGVIRVVRGKHAWTALVEVKTGRNDLQVAQLEAYVDVAREQHFDVVLTISNQLVAPGGRFRNRVGKITKAGRVMTARWQQRNRQPGMTEHHPCTKRYGPNATALLVRCASRRYTTRHRWTLRRLSGTPQGVP